MGRAFVYGDNVDTDVIIPARYLTTTDEAELAKHALEDLDPEFATTVRAGDVVVAGENFGSGSSREHAATCLKAAGVGAVIASSFARIFFRNAINTGLPIAISPQAAASISPGDEVTVDVSSGRIENLTTGQSFTSEALPEFVMEIAQAGGLIPWVRSKLAS